MWNPTTAAEAAATKATATSDSSQEDCSCSSSAASVEQRPPNAASSSDSSGKNAKSTFGGKAQEEEAAAAINQKHKEFALQSETSDSGFISGPQSSQIFSEEIIPETEEQQQPEPKDQEPQQKQKQQQSVVLDSGIIDEDEEEVEEEEPTQEDKSSNQMRLKHSTDAGIPQWTVQSNLAGRGEQLNNLGQSSGGSNSAQISANRSKGPQSTTQSNTAAGPTTNPSSAPQSSINIMNAWEQFYQQNDVGDTPLHLACISGSVDVVTALIRMAPHPCLLNIQNDVAQTPLHLAALTAQPNIMRMLLLAGAEPSVRDSHGNTALHLSCIAGEKQCVRALTEKFGATEIHEAHRQYGHRSNDKAVSSLSYAHLPADLEIRNYDGERCVHLAAEAGHIDILRILVSHGADINAREGKSGRTPLHIAIEGCNEDLANFLLDECEKLNLETATFAGLTAYQFACIMNKSRMQNILEKRGAETVTPPDSDYDSSDIEDLDDTKMYDRFGDPRYFVSYNGGNPMTVA
ncbi:NF-kappa-B inhibitor cactus [Drosophila kikkawai]|uniref:NF-kappa-B inhibitor cactus n=1 Tax=Drosophila kikkawai TaxID=30033 RepID=A0A6P4HUA3_DROKI|nr:NF-kappa-B inhibitor cactus isoform X1 [Drosophila kikkawai]XP_017019221.1 NF-kappa-B inhibitor cactus isoform X1 [Drosophila kikkawai]